MSISSSIKSIQDIMRKDVGVDGDAQRIGQLVWLLFLKIFDDREMEWEMFDSKYKSPLPTKYRWRNWAADPEGMTGDELKSFIDNELFPGLQSLEKYSTAPAAYVVRGVFEDAYNYMKSGQLIRQVINKIQESIDFNKAQERHAFGDMYEQLLRDLQSAGNAGEFYTPRPVTEFMVRMVDPKLTDKVMDPACGTGGFLTCTIEHKRQHYVKTPDDERTLQASIHGVEKKPLPHLLATTNMILHGIEVPNQIRHDNTLARPLISWSPKERVDCIIANPPFGGMEEDGIETNFPAAFRTRETADLFLVLIMHLLRDGGRAAVVLPDGFLFGEGIKSRIKEKLLTECDLHTVVRLPNGVFTDAADFRASWQRLSEHFHTLFTTEASIDALKQTVLQLAVMGKLVPQVSEDESASLLLDRIANGMANTSVSGNSKKLRLIAEVELSEQYADIPDSWVWTRLGSQVLDSGAGWSPSCEARPRVNNEWGVLKVSAVSWGEYRPEENKALPVNLDARHEYEVKAGDFLVSRANTAELVARSVVVESTPPHLMLSDKIVRLKLTEQCNQRYVNLVNSTPAARFYYSAIAGGTSSSMKNVTREQILNLPVPLPPLAEQHRIVAKVDELMTLCDQLKAQLAEARQQHAQLATVLVEQAVA